MIWLTIIANVIDAKILSAFLGAWNLGCSYYSWSYGRLFARKENHFWYLKHRRRNVFGQGGGAPRLRDKSYTPGLLATFSGWFTHLCFGLGRGPIMFMMFSMCCIFYESLPKIEREYRTCQRANALTRAGGSSGRDLVTQWGSSRRKWLHILTRANMSQVRY